MINLLGQMTLNPFENPFLAADRLVEEAARETPVIVVDFHAEATSEKVALAYYLDGRVRPPCSERTPTSRRPTRACSPAARRRSPTPA